MARRKKLSLKEQMMARITETLKNNEYQVYSNTDSSTHSGKDSNIDSNTDSSTHSGKDSNKGSNIDLSIHSGKDSNIDSNTDSSTYSGKDSNKDSNTDSSTHSGKDSNIDSNTGSSTYSGKDSNKGSNTDSSTHSGKDSNKGSNTDSSTHSGKDNNLSIKKNMMLDEIQLSPQYKKIYEYLSKQKKNFTSARQIEFETGISINTIYKGLKRLKVLNLINYKKQNGVWKGIIFEILQGAKISKKEIINKTKQRIQIYLSSETLLFLESEKNKGENFSDVIERLVLSKRKKP